jgi:3-oxoacyl-[acyl-carrier protein] reductase
VAEGIRSAGGVAETAQVDALDERAVEEHADAVAEMTGGIDISFNLISYQDVQGTLLAEMPLRDFERPVTTALRTQFLTARAAARYMISQGSGVILTFGGAGGRDDELWLKIAKKDSNLGPSPSRRPSRSPSATAG